MAVIKNFSYHHGFSYYTNESPTVLADKKMWELKALQSFRKIPCRFLPTQSYPSTRACLTLETMKAKLPWTTIAVVFEMLSDFLAFFGLLTASALTFFGQAPKQPEPPRQPAAPEPGPHQPNSLHGHLCFKAVEHDCSQLLARQAHFLSHREADSLTHGWSKASSLSRNFFGKGFLTVLFKAE